MVLATGYGDLKELALSMGITHFISKPFDILELLQIIESAYESSRQ
ncbi:hypothetical protein [Planktothrix pseudagardhii]|uniref:Response regulator receiver domain protein (CheY) n=1 Tax=Planktothrix pseudagardhii TaxID=132604 RepID=A0A9W4DBL8_9CYAN|nr:hypothetical protein [Planktothrix pseudagardhii]CAD5975188.1 Response regulator receiver domain protein (CheY) [Planktothrix pseudagardhii]